MSKTRPNVMGTKINTFLGAYATEDIDIYKSYENIEPLIEEDKEYILTAGLHTAVVRKNKETSNIEYLELQSKVIEENTFTKLDKKALNDRFGFIDAMDCAKDNLSEEVYKRYKYTTNLIDIDDLENNIDFKRILGFLNTQKDLQQKKAEWGNDDK